MAFDTNNGMVMPVAPAYGGFGGGYGGGFGMDGDGWVILLIIFALFGNGFGGWGGGFGGAGNMMLGYQNGRFSEHAVYLTGGKQWHSVH